MYLLSLALAAGCLQRLPQQQAVVIVILLLPVVVVVLIVSGVGVGRGTRLRLLLFSVVKPMRSSIMRTSENLFFMCAQ